VASWAETLTVEDGVGCISLETRPRLAHAMQTAGELAGLEGTKFRSGARNKHTVTGVSAAPFRERRRDRFREGKQRLDSYYMQLAASRSPPTVAAAAG
jgi:hypothetical protein